LKHETWTYKGAKLENKVYLMQNRLRETHKLGKPASTQPAFWSQNQVHWTRFSFTQTNWKFWKPRFKK